MDAAPMPASQRVVQVCLFLLAAMGMFGGTLQMYLGQPDTTPRLDNVHRFMAGIYFGSALIALWAGATVRRQGTLVFLIAIAVFLGAVGRLVSMSQVGLPDPPAVWLGYLLPELVVPWIIVIAHTLAPSFRHGLTSTGPIVAPGPPLVSPSPLRGGVRGGGQGGFSRGSPHPARHAEVRARPPSPSRGGYSSSNAPRTLDTDGRLTAAEPGCIVSRETSTRVPSPNASSGMGRALG